MHVAVCDDNVADRRQMERLLKRDSDVRSKTSEGLFVDSYGNTEALLANPMQYDIFFIDICKTEGVTGTDVARRLLDAGIQASIVMCCSDIDYRREGLAESVRYLNKAIRADELKAELDRADEQKKNAVPLIELRQDKDTIYVTEEDIMYGVRKGKYVQIHLADGRIIPINSNISRLFGQWEHFDPFLAPTSKMIVNCRHIAKIGAFSFTMTDGTMCPANSACRGYAKNFQRRL